MKCIDTRQDFGAERGLEANFYSFIYGRIVSQKCHKSVKAVFMEFKYIVGGVFLLMVVLAIYHNSKKK